MPRRKITIAIAALVLCASLAWMFWPEKEIPEPIYKGKKLGQWLDQAAAQGTLTLEINEALQAIGTNAIPCYLRWIDYEPSLHRKFGRYLTTRTRGWPNVAATPGTPKEIRAFYAFHALAQLGEGGAPAIPQLLAYATRPPGTLPSLAVKSPVFAINAFRTMGRPGMTAYLSLVTNRDARVRALAIEQSPRFSRHFYLFPKQTAQFQKCLDDPDYHVRVAATNVLKSYTPIAAKPTTP
jgi:hypothetical protein